MYKRQVLLDENYQISAEKIIDACDENTKVVWFCSPNNPTGNHINREAIVEVLRLFDGIDVYKRQVYARSWWKRRLW